MLAGHWDVNKISTPLKLGLPRIHVSLRAVTSSVLKLKLFFRFCVEIPLKYAIFIPSVLVYKPRLPILKMIFLLIS